jgi:hypothetical protein
MLNLVGGLNQPSLEYVDVNIVVVIDYVKNQTLWCNV